MPVGQVMIFSWADSMVCADPATRSSPAPGSLDMVAYEQQAGLRPKDDTLPDKERRQQVDAHSLTLLNCLCLSAALTDRLDDVVADLESTSQAHTAGLVLEVTVLCLSRCKG